MREEVVIEVPTDLFERLEALPGKNDRRGTVFTKEMDQAILKYWPVKIHRDVAKALGLAPNTVLERYRFLTEV